MVSSYEDIHFLEETLGFWKQLNQSQKMKLQNIIIKKSFLPGESMHSNSEYCSGLYLIHTGQVRAYIVSESGKEITLYRLFDRDVCIFSASCIMRNMHLIFMWR